MTIQQGIFDPFQSHQPLFMGILNVTPDSFSDGKPKASIEDFLTQAEGLIGDGAHILDVGGESTRPYKAIGGLKTGGSRDDKVSTQEECDRVLPFLEAFRKKNPEFPISLDTKKLAVAKAAEKYSIQIVNDVSCVEDPDLARWTLEQNKIYVLMHSRKKKNVPLIDQTDYLEGVVVQILKELKQELKFLENLTSDKSRLWIDPGFGFAKTPEQCVEVMNHLTEFLSLDHPVLVGLSRKKFLQLYGAPEEPSLRDQITAELNLKALNQGCQIIRTHNVALTKRLFEAHLNIAS